MAHIVGIRFHGGGKTYHFNASSVPEIKKGEYVIVETSRGQQLGQVVSFQDPGGKKGRNWKPILRSATSRDLVMRQVWEKKEQKVLEDCRKLAREEKILEEVKFVSAEFSLEGENLVFLYCYEGNEDPNLGNLLKKLKKENPEANLELRRIGPRDSAKIIGGMGACGREVRCCTEFMTEFIPISIKMAKEQGSAGVGITPKLQIKAANQAMNADQQQIPFLRFTTCHRFSKLDPGNNTIFQNEGHGELVDARDTPASNLIMYPDYFFNRRALCGSWVDALSAAKLMMILLSADAAPCAISTPIKELSINNFPISRSNVVPLQGAARGA